MLHLAGGHDAANATAGFLFQKGALDFAGGTVVHQRRCGGPDGAFLVGKRIGFGRGPCAHSLTLTIVGASCCGWAGSASMPLCLEANGVAAMAFVNTWATAAATVSWLLAEWIIKGKPSGLGAASGAVAGLVAITPACGFVGVVGPSSSASSPV